MIQVDQLYKKFPNALLPSVNDLSFSFRRGSISGILGPNGAGKTTTISILSGALRDYKGKVQVMGFQLPSQSNSLAIALGLVPQQIALYPNLSCRENLQYFGSLYPIPSVELRKRMEEALDYFGLKEHEHKLIRHFSGGMKRRANIIASLLHQPDLLILDEPTAGVDVQSRNHILRFLREYRDRGHSVIYTSHILEEAEHLCDDILIMDQGKKIVQGHPLQLISDYKVNDLESLFLQLTGYKLRDMV